MRQYGYRLGLFAALAALSACGPTGLEELPVSPGDTVAVAQSLACGGLASGEALGRGQSLASCNGRATLAHQTDGNVVLYDGAGASWATYTAPRTDTTWFVMQTDGNLVLYSNAGAVWSSGTAGNPGARLAIQDDCNLIIYNSSGQNIWSRNTYCRINLLDYMLNNGGALRDPTYGDMQQTRVSGSQFWYLKNPSNGKRWERYRYDSNRIWLERDTTLPVGEGPGEAYDNTPAGSLWMPRIWSPVNHAPNRLSAFSTTHKYFNFINAPVCGYNNNTTAWPKGMHQFRFLGNIDMGGNLGVQDVAIIDRYHDRSCSGCQYMPPVAERFWFAKGRGWVRWEYWADRTTDPYWNSSNLNDIVNNTQPARSPNSSASKRRTFNTNATAVTFADVCTSLVP
jgi:hypothetical protein